MEKDIIDELMGLDRSNTYKTIDESYIKNSDYNYQGITANSEVTESSNVTHSTEVSLIKVGVNFEECVIDSKLDTHEVTLDINDDIPIIVTANLNKNKVDNLIIGGIDNFKDYIKSTIDKLYETIDILKQELVEKNVLIRALISRDRNNSNITVSNTSVLSVSTGPKADSTNRTYYIHDDDKKLITGETITTSSFDSINESILCPTPVHTTNDADETSKADGKFKFANQFTWERHSSGIASKLLDKMGYRGQGLGKHENGIIEAIDAKPANKFKTEEKKSYDEKNRKKICILSGSMLNRLDEKRLSNDYVDVRLRCHGGCTIKCLYTHLPWAFALQPEHIIIHVGTNDCAKKTSDEVLKELFDVRIYIQKVLPSCKIWFSLPLVRTDDKRANVIIRHLNIKMMKQCDMILDNSNIKECHLSRKGLHLNDHGTKLMAKNIISHIKYI